MKWHLYSLTFQLKSPLHIGFHKVMHFFKTRTYLPAKPFWGALTAKLTRELNLTDYEKVGNYLRRAIRFSYFYLSDGNKIFIPQYTDKGLKFGNLSQFDFKKRFISSVASVAIESNSMTAEEGMLHEVEFISPYTLKNERPVFLKGLLWISEFSEGELSIMIEDNDFFISYRNIQVKFSELTNILQVGGERKYGFGLIKMKEFEKKTENNLKNLGFVGKWKENKDEVVLKLEKGNPIWSHVKHNNFKIKGIVEPVVGRDWDSRGTGRKLNTYGLCWAPGSILIENKNFRITQEFGLWKMI